MKNSKIEWTDHTANLWIGCTEVHEGCDNCYARVLNNRWGHKNWGNEAPRRAVKKVWNDIKKWQKEAAAAGRIDRVFVGSMMDIFEKDMPLAQSLDWGLVKFETTGQLRLYFFGVVVPQCKNLQFLLLTKRPSNINKMIPDSWKTNPPANVMFGTSVVNQATADRLVPQLLKVNGYRFLSCEPLLGPIKLDHMDVDKAGDEDWCFINSLTGRQTDMGRPCPDVPKIHWVIVGGESGHKRRPFSTEWAYWLHSQCLSANVPFFMKQIDKVIPVPADLMIRQFPN